MQTPVTRGALLPPHTRKDKMEPLCEAVKVEVSEEPIGGQASSTSQHPSGVDRVSDPSEDALSQCDEMDIKEEEKEEDEPIEDFDPVAGYAVFVRALKPKPSSTSNHSEDALSKCDEIGIKEEKKEDVCIKDEPIEDLDAVTGCTTFAPALKSKPRSKRVVGMPPKRERYLSKEDLERYVNSEDFNKTVDITTEGISDDGGADESVCGDLSSPPPDHPVPSTSRASPQLSETVIECTSDPSGGVKAVITPHKDKQKDDGCDDPDTVIECSQSGDVSDLQACVTVRKEIPTTSRLRTKRRLYASTPQLKKRRNVATEVSDDSDPDYIPDGWDDYQLSPVSNGSPVNRTIIHDRSASTSTLTQCTSATATPTQDTSATATPTQGTSGTATPTQGTSATATPTQGTSGTATPTQGTSGTATPTQGTSGTPRPPGYIRHTPTQGTSGTATPTQGTSATATPTQGTSGTATPTQSTSATATPTQGYISHCHAHPGYTGHCHAHPGYISHCHVHP
ncbi:nuclear pore complex protein DDB_G0274915-like [Eriocheir sinensis]|uniref:nuclear pore complex protein DDB_G0274915-like n=1 Tax=Eriocheir sinensis TaxID=95602 RepID=UPI0021C66EC4|nr:nuclear pore complex protein DDB_G0274915-like [Eriocheir sinensis]